jgi:integrase
MAKNTLKTNGSEKAKSIPLNFTPPEQGTQSLYRRGETLYALFRIPGERVPIRLSMGTTVVTKAKEKAYHEFINLQTQLRSGKPRRQAKFRAVAEMVQKRLKGELEKRLEFGEFEPGGERLRHPETLGKKIKQIGYLIEHFGDRPIPEITDADIKAFKSFIATYWTKGPGVEITKFDVIKNGKPLEVTRRKLGIASRNTVNQYMMTLNEVLRVAKKEFKVEPTLGESTYATRDVNPRLSFTPKQYRDLVALQEQRIAQEKREHHKKRLRRVIWMMEFMVNSGIRAAELRGLKWGQIEVLKVAGGKTLQFHGVKSKNKPARSVICKADIMATYDAMLASIDGVPDPNAYLFSSEFDPHKQGKLMDGFQALVQKAKLWEDGKGGYRTLGSIRHTYAQERIHNMDPYNLFLLASNMGTSEKQIRDFYASDIQARESARALVGTIPDDMTGLVDVFKDAQPAKEKPAAEPWKSDAREFARIMDDAHGSGWVDFGTSRLLDEVTEIYNDLFNASEKKELIKSAIKITRTQSD